MPKVSKEQMREKLGQYDTLRELKRLRKNSPKGSELRRSVDTVIRTMQKGFWGDYNKKITELKQNFIDANKEEDEEKRKANPPMRHIGRFNQFISVPNNIMQYVKNKMK